MSSDKQKDQEGNQVADDPKGKDGVQTNAVETPKPCPPGKKRNKDGVCQDDDGNDTHP